MSIFKRESYSWEPDTSRTLFYYEFENNLNDSSGNNNNITDSANVTYDTVNWQKVIKNTWASSALKFNSTLWRFWTWDFAVSFWINPLDVSNTYSVLVFWCWYESSPYPWVNVFWRRWTTSDKVCFRLTNQNQIYSTQSVSQLAWSWHHVVFTRINWVCYAYIDNVLQWTMNDTTNINSADTAFILSRNDWAASAQSRPSAWAMMDKVIMENVWWTSDNVDAYYNSVKNIYQS